MGKAKCLICNSRDGVFQFPRGRSDLFLWMNNLGLDDIPNSKDRLCPDHFSLEDIIFYGRQRGLKQGALPLSQVIKRK